MSGIDLEQLSRHEFARLVALLAGKFGSHRIDLAEDAVQDAFAAAVRGWGTQGPPDDPAGWLYRVARNRLIDRLRRVEPDAPVTPEVAAAPPVEPGAGDDELRLILLCCHPSLSPESQVALTLRIAAGFSVTEIARLLRAAEDAVDQRLVRARKALRAAGPAFDLSDREIAERAATARAVLYAMFSEGYASVTAPTGLRRELCFEALRIARAMLASAGTASAEGHALAALFALQASRLDVRVDGSGEFRSLREQDRSRWNQGLIAAGFQHLRRSMGSELSRYHLEAEIAGVHAVAERYEATDWNRIVDLYDLLAARWPTPAVALARAVAIGERDGPAAGRTELLAVAGSLGEDPYWHAAMADQLERLGDLAGARRHASRAADLVTAPSGRRVFEARATRLRDADVGIAGADPT